MISDKSFYAMEYKNLKERRKHFHLSSTEREQHLLCAKCNDILVELQQTNCGCRFCLACITNVIQQCETLCPGCNDVVTSIKENIRYDRAVEKEIFKLKMTCINEPCLETFKLRDLVVHLEKCDHRQNKCNACGMLYLHNEMMKHERVTCKMLITNCKDCGREMRKKDLEEQHRNINGDLSLLCDNWMDICPYKCSEDTQYNIKTHLDICVRMPVECNMKNIGCTKILPRIDMDEHIRSEVHHHMSLMMAEINILNLDNAKIKSESFEGNKKLTLEIDRLKKEVDNSSSEVRKLTEKLAICESHQPSEDFGSHILLVRDILSMITAEESASELLPISHYILVLGLSLRVVISLDYESSIVSLFVEVMQHDAENELHDMHQVLVVTWKNHSRSFDLNNVAPGGYRRVDTITMSMDEWTHACENSEDLSLTLGVFVVPSMEGGPTAHQ